MPKILKDRFKNFHLNKFALLLALIHYFIVIFFEKDFFKEYSFNNSELTIAKLLVLISLWQILALMLKQYIISLQYRRYIHFSMIYFSISLLFLIFVWPGNWQYDDLDILDFVRNFRILPWQSYLMSYFYYIALFIFPSPVFVVILQITIISLIVGYIVYTLDFILNGSKIAWIVYIPFILPPVIIQNYYPLRATIFSYLIIFLIVRINFLAWKNSQISIKEILIISIITSVIANIRGEGLIFLFFIPLIFFLGLRKYNRLNYNMIFLSSIIASFFIVSIPQYMSTSKYQRSLYSLTTVIQPVSYLLIKMWSLVTMKHSMK